MKKITFLAIFMVLSLLAAGAAGLSGVYKVGVSETAPNFSSLNAAFEALNTQGLTGNVVLEITSDITEAANIGLGVNTGGFSIIIRPDADADRTVTFTQLTDNTSPTGHLVIGYPTSGLTQAWADANTIGTDNVTIDGYAVGGTTRRLTFTNTNASHTGARVIVVVGDCENVTIRNCNVINNTTSTSSPFCVGAVVRKGTAIEVGPTNLTFENNVLTALGNNVAMGSRITNSGTLTTVKATNVVYKNNIIQARRRLIEVNYTNNMLVEGNEFIQDQTGAAGTISYGLWTSSGVTGTVNILNNKFIRSTTEEVSGNGHRTVSLSSGATYNVFNNTFAGMDKTKPSTTATNLVYLFYSGVAGKIYNNTFYMPQLTDPSSTGYYAAIQLSGNTAEIKNNIFVSNESTHSNAYFISAVPTPESDFNRFYTLPSNSTHKYVAAFLSLTDYQDANPTKDISSKVVNVTFENAAAGNLLLAGESVQDANLAVARLSDVSKDILGTDRSELTYAGAHEAKLPFISTHNPAVEQTARILRTPEGVLIELDSEALIEIYAMNGAKIESVRTSGSYTKDLEKGIYIIRINGVGTKFMK